jgi:hypothetical protein
MRSSTIFFAGLVAVAHAQIDASIISQIPACATGPLVSGISGSGCQITDSACICGNQKLIADLQTAVKAQCSEADLASKFLFCPAPGRKTVLTVRNRGPGSHFPDLSSSRRRPSSWRRILCIRSRYLCRRSRILCFFGRGQRCHYH